MPAPHPQSCAMPVQLEAAVAAKRTKDIPGQALRVDADDGWRAGNISMTSATISSGSAIWQGFASGPGSGFCWARVPTKPKMRKCHRVGKSASAALRTLFQRAYYYRTPFFPTLHVRRIKWSAIDLKLLIVPAFDQTGHSRPRFRAHCAIVNFPGSAVSQRRSAGQMLGLLACICVSLTLESGCALYANFRAADISFEAVILVALLLGTTPAILAGHFYPYPRYCTANISRCRSIGCW